MCVFNATHNTSHLSVCLSACASLESSSVQRKWPPPPTTRRVYTSRKVVEVQCTPAATNVQLTNKRANE